MIRVVVGLVGSMLLLVGCSGSTVGGADPVANGGSGGASVGSSGSGGGVNATAGTGGGCSGLDCPGQPCGGELGDGACSLNQYCAYTEGALCGAADATSTCQSRPASCDDIYAPVCGCDRKTYPSSCDAAMHGQGVYMNGVCPGDTVDAGTACGARAGNTCAADEYCSYQAGSLCGAADGEATCAPRPSVCGKNLEPVCGCDQKTYTSPCDAALHGQGVYTNGACDNSAAH